MRQNWPPTHTLRATTHHNWTTEIPPELVVRNAFLGLFPLWRSVCDQIYSPDSLCLREKDLLCQKNFSESPTPTTYVLGAEKTA